jgi:hypothetical protein
LQPSAFLIESLRWKPRGRLPDADSNLAAEHRPRKVVLNQMANAAAMSAWSWLPPILWECPRCLAVYLVRELGPRCRLCGYHEQDS